MRGHPGEIASTSNLLPDFGPAAAEIGSLVTGRLEAVDALFRRNLASPVRIVQEIVGFVGEGGGKRVRPTLHLLCARLCEYHGVHDVLMATVLEFIHSATLIHDDIIDEATTRRGRPSVNQRWGNNVTVLFGDYLYARAMQMALEAGSLRIMEKLADVTLRMTEGEMLQTRYAGRLDLTVDEHLDLVERKTAALFGACCEIAGILAEVGSEKEAALRRYGVQLGLAFQLVDDLLDFTGDAKTLGKPAASDLREGKATLAVIDLLSTGSSRARTLAARVVESGQAMTPEIVELTALLHESGAIARTQARARQCAARAEGELDRFRECPERRALRSVPEILLLRDR
jgi:octaprenyl-diphosphate synthase